MYLRPKCCNFLPMLFKFGTNIPGWNHVDKFVSLNNPIVITPIWWIVSGGFLPQRLVFGPQGVIFSKLHLFLYNMVQLVKTKVKLNCDFPSFLFYVYKKVCSGWLRYVSLYKIPHLRCWILQFWSKFDQNEMGWQLYSLTSALCYMRSHLNLRLSL